LVIKDVVVKDSAGAPAAVLKRLEVCSSARSIRCGSKFVIDRVSVDSPEIHARVSRQGTINWIDFFSQELGGARGGRDRNESGHRLKSCAGGVVAGRSEDHWRCRALARRVAWQAVQRER
jgi:hypothetical protein